MDPGFPTTFGEFHANAILGEGGSGIVYAATWGPRQVALKVLHPSLVGTERVRSQFFAEAERLKAIAHPSVVKVLAVGELPDGRPYLAMELLAGETLAAVLAKGALSLAKALELFGELCAAVAALHERGLIHRDLKPENVFIVDGRHAVLLDFGIAKELASPASTTTQDGGVRGTPAYMAPERFFGQSASVATDVYELAVTLYAMLAGRLPWDDVGDPEARLTPRPLVELAAVPNEVDVEIRRALSTRAQNRPASAIALYEAIRAAAGSEPGTAADTARMRAASDAAATPHRGWFAKRPHATDPGKTPLAWVSSNAPRPELGRRRWPWLVAGIVVVAAGTGAWWRARKHAIETTTTPVAMLPPERDPWGAQRPVVADPVVIPALAISGPPVTPAVARAEIAAALIHVPVDTQLVFTGVIGELRGNEQFASILDKAAQQPKAAELLAMAPPCLRSLLGGAEWFVVATTMVNSGSHGTLLLRGRWTRLEVERCFAGQTESLAMTDGATILQLPHVGWLDFVDDHTVYISVRDDLAAAQVHDLVTHGHGATAHTRELFAALPAARSVAFAIDGTNVEYPNNALPAGTDASGWLRVDRDGAAFDAVIDPHDEAIATKLEAEVRPQLAAVFGTAKTDATGKIEVTRHATALDLHGAVTNLMIGLVVSSLP